MATSFPPHRTAATVSVPQSAALKYLSSYIAALPTSPYLLPNARLEASGPTAGSSNSVTIHNLKRVEAGLRGEWLAPTLEIEEGKGVTVEGEGEEKQGGEWQDLEEYQREQSIEEGEIGARQAGEAIGVDSEVEKVDANGGQEDDGADSASGVEEAREPKKIKTTHTLLSRDVKRPLDKEARKREKKARMKEEKRQKEKERQAKAKDKA